jgi:hypothetical protein
MLYLRAAYTVAGPGAAGSLIEYIGAPISGWLQLGGN